MKLYKFVVIVEIRDKKRKKMKIFLINQKPGSMFSNSSKLRTMT